MSVILLYFYFQFLHFGKMFYLLRSPVLSIFIVVNRTYFTLYIVFATTEYLIPKGVP